MNQTFRTSRPSNRQLIFRQMLLALAIAAAFPILQYLLWKRIVNESYFYMIGVAWIFGFILEFFRKRVIEIEFNSDARQIIFHYETFLVSGKIKTLSFQNARLYTDTRHRLRGKTLVLYFESMKVEYFKVEKKKDGFTEETLANIRDFANELAIPVAKY